MADNLTLPEMCSAPWSQVPSPDVEVPARTWQRNSGKALRFGGLKHWGVKRVEIATSRCMKCGYLESYARGAERPRLAGLVDADGTAISRAAGPAPTCLLRKCRTRRIFPHRLVQAIFPSYTIGPGTRWGLP